MRTRRRPPPLATQELKMIKEQWGEDRVVRKLLWEISRLRDTVYRWYEYHIQLSHYSRDLNKLSVHGDFEDLFEEPLILERMPKPLSQPSTSRSRRWPHMSEEAEDKLIAKIEAGDTLAVREAKRHTREAR